MTDARDVQAVLGFLGACSSGLGWRLYLLFSRGGGVATCRVNVSRAEEERDVGSTEMVSESSDSMDGNPLYVAISRWRARRCPSLKSNAVRSSSVMSTIISQVWKPLSTRGCRYLVNPNRTRTSFRCGIVQLDVVGIGMT
jgi:hypothetical protein